MVAPDERTELLLQRAYLLSVRSAQHGHQLSQGDGGLGPGAARPDAFGGMRVSRHPGRVVRPCAR